MKPLLGRRRHHGRGVVRRREGIRRASAGRAVQDDSGDRMWELVCPQIRRWEGVELADLTVVASTLLVSQLFFRVARLAAQVSLIAVAPQVSDPFSLT